MNSTPFFSIVIPTYNRANLLLKAVASVIAQTFHDWELIIVDDGSTDNTAEVIKQVKDERVRYIYQVNAERCAARNNGIDNASGKYICFLDSDDYFLPERLQLLYSEITSQNFAEVMFYTGLLVEKNDEIAPQGIQLKATDNVMNDILQSNIHSQQVALHSKILREFKYDKRFRIGEDMELWLRIAKKYKVVFIPNQSTVVVVSHDDRSINVRRNNVGAEELTLFKHIFSPHHAGDSIDKEIQAYMNARAYHSIARYHVHQGNRLSAITAIIRAISADIKSDWFKLRVYVLLHLAILAPMNKVKDVIGHH